MLPCNLENSDKLDIAVLPNQVLCIFLESGHMRSSMNWLNNNSSWL